MPGGKDPEDETGCHRKQEGKPENAGIQSDVTGTQYRNVLRSDLPEKLDAPVSDQQPGRSAKQREHDALGQRLAGKTPPRRPHGRPDRHFAATRRRAREKQVRDIDTGNQQDERDCGQERQQAALHRRPQLVAQQ